MPFDPNSKSTPFISVEGPGARTGLPDVAASSRKNFSVVSTAHPTNEYEDQIISMRIEITDLIDALCALRTEAESFIEWRHGMGEGTGASSWGMHQQTYSRQLHLQHRALAANLKAACEHRSPGNSGKWIDKVFATASRYGDVVTAQAREELEL
jgi:hypothetical protein